MSTDRLDDSRPEVLNVVSVGELLLDDEHILLRAKVQLNTGFPQGPGEAILTDRRVLWTPSRDITNIALSWSPAVVEVMLAEIERVWVWAWMPSRILRIRTDSGRYAFDFIDARLTLSPSSWRRALVPGLTFREARRKSIAWEAEIRRLAPKLSAPS